MAATDTDVLCYNTIRILSADQVQYANSGHPGAPMGMAPIAHLLWSKYMNINAESPSWANRDRFVLSNGHGCALLYSMLHLTGFKTFNIEELKKFRTLEGKTCGHPENEFEGIEVTTGPLGQGISNAVGLAAAEAHLGAVYNKPDFTLFDNYTYVFCGDGFSKKEFLLKPLLLPVILA
jgi:transketolase